MLLLFFLEIIVGLSARLCVQVRIEHFADSVKLIVYKMAYCD